MVSGGKCGICGDAFSASRDHETGGKFATTTIVREYLQGALIDVKILVRSFAFFPPPNERSAFSNLVIRQSQRFHGASTLSGDERAVRSDAGVSERESALHRRFRISIPRERERRSNLFSVRRDERFAIDHSHPALIF